MLHFHTVFWLSVYVILLQVLLLDDMLYGQNIISVIFETRVGTEYYFSI